MPSKCETVGLMPRVKCYFRSAIVLLSLLLSGRAAAAPGDVLFFEDFNASLVNWTIAANGGDAGLGSETSVDGTSLRLRWGQVSATSIPIDARVPGIRVDFWVRRGADSFSEDPDGNEDLAIEYLNDVGSWVTVSTYAGNGGSPGDIFDSGFILGSDALHADLQIRFRQTGGSGPDWDYWHVDDVSVTEVAAAEPFGVGRCMTFDSGLGSWRVEAAGGDAGISTATASSGASSLFTRWGDVSVVSNTVDLSGYPDARVSAWIQRGSDSFSEDPDAGENLQVDFIDSDGTWVTLGLYLGDGSPGEVLRPEFDLPSEALHADFRLRVRQVRGNGVDWDYWHVDDVCLSATRQITFRFEENEWVGMSGEVMDSGVLALSGVASGGASTAQSSPALAGNPGTCRYGDFDGIDDFVEVPDSNSLDFPDAVSVAVWIQARSLPGSGLTCTRSYRRTGISSSIPIRRAEFSGGGTTNLDRRER